MYMPLFPISEEPNQKVLGPITHKLLGAKIPIAAAAVSGDVKG